MSGDDKGTEAGRAIAGFLLGLALGALVGLLAKRRPGDGDDTRASA